MLDNELPRGDKGHDVHNYPTGGIDQGFDIDGVVWPPG